MTRLHQHLQMNAEDPILGLILLVLGLLVGLVLGVALGFLLAKFGYVAVAIARWPCRSPPYQRWSPSFGVGQRHDPAMLWRRR